MSIKERRAEIRCPVETIVTVNNGNPYTAGNLRDISLTGAAITYPNSDEFINDQIKIGQMLNLNYECGAMMSGTVARIFEGGFATRFD